MKIPSVCEPNDIWTECLRKVGIAWAEKKYPHDKNKHKPEIAIGLYWDGAFAGKKKLTSEELFGFYEL